MHQDKGVLRLIAIPFALFVVLGSLALVIWLGERDRLESKASFVRLAETNADFVRRSNLPASGRLANSLSEILEMAVVFRKNGRLLSPAMARVGFAPPELTALTASESVVTLDANREAIVVELLPGTDVIFVRNSSAFFANYFRVSTLLPLGAFWLFSFLLALFITRNLVRPIHRLAASVSSLNPMNLNVPAFPGSDRNDEIGHLARTLTNTHENLRDERIRREESEKLALLGRMTTGLAHEIRNPVAAVQMHAQLLIRTGVGTETARLIEGEAETIEDLVTQWMFLARPQPPNVAQRDLRDSINRCVEKLRASFDHARVQCRVHVEEPLFCEADEKRLSQAIRNALVNAVQAMPDGGNLTINGQASGNNVVVLIRDNGRGFSEEALNRFDELFYSTKEGGMGVGMSVASEVVKAHGGSIAVENNPDEGATVTISLPAQRSTANKAPTS